MLGNGDFPTEEKVSRICCWEHMGLGRWAELSSISGLTSLWWWLLLHERMWVQGAHQ